MVQRERKMGEVRVELIEIVSIGILSGVLAAIVWAFLE